MKLFSPNFWQNVTNITLTCKPFRLNRTFDVDLSSQSIFSFKICISESEVQDQSSTRKEAKVRFLISWKSLIIPNPEQTLDDWCISGQGRNAAIPLVFRIVFAARENKSIWVLGFLHRVKFSELWNQYSTNDVARICLWGTRALVWRRTYAAQLMRAPSLGHCWKG